LAPDALVRPRQVVTAAYGQDFYAHLQKVLVTPGPRVEPGQVLAPTGNSAPCSGPHLHYEVTVKGQAVNPRSFLRE
jgi:murein DD-endopeptidase MepM/ murein hydrolase activator NlpD